MPGKLNVTVLFGGPSAEREVSLVSGPAVAEGLRRRGHAVFGSDIGPHDLSALDVPCDMVFPVLHGTWGESGELQEILERRGVYFVGSGSRASRLGMDKQQTKRVWAQAGLPVAESVVISAGQSFDTTRAVGLPCVVKPVASGSSIDVFICKSETEARAAVAHLLAKDGRAMIERFVRGIELTVGLLEERPLDPIRIIPSGEFFDYEAKYKAAGTEHRFDTDLPDAVGEHCRELARRANELIGARDLARVDMIVDERNQPWLLEINTLPGFTPKSLLPEAAAHAGIGFDELVDRLAKRALRRGRAAA